MISFPWDSIIEDIDDDGYPILDRALNAAQMWDIYSTYFSDGVFMPRVSDQYGYFKVTPGSGLTVQVDSGRCNIGGCFGFEPNVREMVLQAAAGGNRIDTIVLRKNENIEARKIDIYVKQGVVSNSPKRPDLTRNDTIYELGLADIYIPNGASSISASWITDTRLDNKRCGIVNPLLEMDTTGFYDQLQEAVQLAVDAMQAAIDGTTAGNLQNQITNLKSELAQEVKDRKSEVIPVDRGGTGKTEFSAQNVICTDGSGKITSKGSESAGFLGWTSNGALGIYPHPLSISSGGTGARSSREAEYNISKDVPEYDNAFGDGALIVGKWSTPSATNGAFYARPASKLFEYMWKRIYPVGSLYIAYTSESPASRFGGEWTQITGRFLRAANDVSTGGSDTHTLTKDQMPNHSHSMLPFSDSSGGNSGHTSYYSKYASTYTNSGGTGGGAAHNNMPAYQDVYVWRRTA